MTVDVVETLSSVALPSLSIKLRGVFFRPIVISNDVKKSLSLHGQALLKRIFYSVRETMGCWLSSTWE